MADSLGKQTGKNDRPLSGDPFTRVQSVGFWIGVDFSERAENSVLGPEKP